MNRKDQRKAAAPPPPAPPADLDALLAYWKPIVRLADWEITARYERHLTRSEWVTVQYEYRIAAIEVMDPIDSPATCPRPYDAERYLLHGMIHCHFAPFATVNGTPLGHVEEQAVEAWARSLLALKRGTPR